MGDGEVVSDQISRDVASEAHEEDSSESHTIHGGPTRLEAQVFSPEASCKVALLEALANASRLA